MGISTALLGRAVAGMAVAAAVAEGNALGKGPVVFALPPSAVAAVRSRAAAGQAPFQQLLSNMYRWACKPMITGLCYMIKVWAVWC